MKIIKQIFLLPKTIFNLISEVKQMQRKYTPKHHIGK